MAWAVLRVPLLMSFQLMQISWTELKLTIGLKGGQGIFHPGKL